MKFQKLALAAAVAAAPTAGMAMEPMEDAALSSVTGQDGISIAIDNINLSMNVGIEDTDGVATGGSTYTNPGMLLILGQSISTGTTAVAGGINIEMDTGSDATTTDHTAMLEVRVDIPHLELTTGDIYAVDGTAGTSVTAGINNVNAEVAAITGTTPTNTNNPIMDSTSISLDNLALTIQLGAEEDNFLQINSSSTLTVAFGTLGNTADNFTINDANGASISMDRQEIRNITFGTTGITGDVVDAGLALTVGTDALTNVDIAMMGVTLGNTAASTTDINSGALGNVYITGLNLSGTTITIGGH